MRTHPRRAKPPTLPRGILFPDLATYCAETGDTQVAIAAATGASQAHISRIINGAAIPRPALAMRIARYARIPLESFTRAYLANHADEARTA